MNKQSPSAYPLSAQAARSHIRRTRRAKCAWVPVSIVTLDLILYAFTLLAVIATHNWIVKAGLIIVNGQAIGMLFTIGHDACHGSFTCDPRLNRFIGKLSFLPSLTPYTQWRYIHNYLHHSFTNCRDHDFAWRPLSHDEYRMLRWYRRVLERTYRTPLGLPLYWIIENWLCLLIFPNAKTRAEMKKWGNAEADRLKVLGWLGLEVSIVILHACSVHEYRLSTEMTLSVFSNLCCGIVFPFIVWSWLISLVTLLHHTPPSLCWHTSRREVSFSESQIQGTVHVLFPFPLGLIYHNIMEHTAHHVDPGIPMYQLGLAQDDLKTEQPASIIVEKFSVRYLFRVLRVCKLYDYSAHRWVGYDGLPATAISNDEAAKRTE
jgi:omega-6 fatty acid desaturase (delta-12 desaturase)